MCCKPKNGSPRWTHTQTQTDTRTKYIREATQTDARDHFWASKIHRTAGDALTLARRGPAILLDQGLYRQVEWRFGGRLLRVRHPQSVSLFGQMEIAE
jgi:hypothetical protein